MIMKSQLKPIQLEATKERKIRPLKQPVKQQRPLLLMDKGLKTQETKDKFKQTQERKLLNRETICESLLEQGSIQSFIDLFYIAHKCLPNVMERKNYFGEPLHIGQPQQEQSIPFHQQFANSLARAETSSAPQSSMNQYNSIAFNYEEQGDFATAAYFYQKVVNLALAHKNKQYEIVALVGLGKCYDQSGKQNEAIDIFEEAFSQIESKEEESEMVKLVSKELIEIYINKASEEKEEALMAYQNGLSIARRSKNLEAEARISHKIGELYYEEGMYDQSVEYQEQYLRKLEVANEMEKDDSEKKELKFKEMEAHASLAKCYLKLKSIQQAESHLNEYHKMAKEAKAQNSVADSSYYLAKLFEEKGEHDKTIAFYQLYFEAAKSEKLQKKDRKLVDKARVTYAIARANRNMDKYIGIFQAQNSLKNILDWKIKRILK